MMRPDSVPRSLNTVQLVFTGFLVWIGVLVGAAIGRAQGPPPNPLCAAVAPGFSGQCNGPAQTYQTIVLSVSFVRTDSMTVLLAEKTVTFDIATVGTGQQVAVYMDDVEVPPGSYRGARVLLRPTLVIRGDVTLADGRTCRTCAACNPADGAAPENFNVDLTMVPNLQVDPNGNVAVTIISDGIATVEQDDIVTMDIAFDVGNAVVYNFTALPGFQCASAGLGVLSVEIEVTVNNQVVSDNQ